MIYLVIGAACIVALLIVLYGDKSQKAGRLKAEKDLLAKSVKQSEKLNEIETEIDRTDDTVRLRDELRDDFNDK